MAGITMALLSVLDILIESEIFIQTKCNEKWKSCKGIFLTPFLFVQYWYGTDPVENKGRNYSKWRSNMIKTESLHICEILPSLFIICLLVKYLNENSNTIMLYVLYG